MRTLVEVLTDYSKEINGQPYEIHTDILIAYLEQILETPEFKDVKKINILSTPIYKVTEDGIPLEYVKDYLGTELYKVEVAEDYIYVPGESEFNEEVDIVDMELVHKNHNVSNLGMGVWKYPLLYSPVNFHQKDKIVINYSFTDIKENFHLTDEQTKTYIKNVVLPQVAALIESGETNVPFSSNIRIRCSKRSVKNITKEDKTKSN